MTIRRKLYNQKRHIVAILLFLFIFMILVRLTHTLYWVIRLKNNGFMIDNIDFDPLKGPKIKFSVKTYEDCPLNFDISEIKASIGFEKQSSLEDLKNLVVQFHISSIRARKHVSMNFEGFVEFDSCDFSKFSNLIGKRKLEFNLKMYLNLRFLMAPLAFSINKTVYTFDPSRFYKDILVKEKPGELKLTDDICENVNGLFKKSVFRSFGVKKVKYSLAELRQEAINNGLTPPEQQDANHSDLVQKDYYEVEIKGNSLIKSIYVNNININVESRKIKFISPFNSFIIIKKFIINKKDWLLVALIPNIEDSSLVIESLLYFFKNGNLKIKIESFSSILDVGKIPRLKNDFSITFPFSKPANEPLWPQNYKFVCLSPVTEKTLNHMLFADLTRFEMVCFMLCYQILKDETLKLLVSAFGAKVCMIQIRIQPFFNSDDSTAAKSFVFHQNIVKNFPVLHFTIVPIKKIVFNLDQGASSLLQLKILNQDKFFNGLCLIINEEVSLLYRSNIYKMYKNFYTKSQDVQNLAPEVHNDNRAVFENDGSIKILSNARTKNQKNSLFSAFNFDFNFDLSVKCNAFFQNSTNAPEYKKSVGNMKVQFTNCRFGFQFGKNIARNELFYLNLEDIMAHFRDLNVDIFNDIKNIKSVVFTVSIFNRRLTKIVITHQLNLDNFIRRQRACSRAFLSKFLMNNLMFDQLVSQNISPFVDLSIEFFSNKNSFIQGFKFSSSKSSEPKFGPLILFLTFSIDPIVFFDKKSATCISLERAKFCIKKFHDGIHMYIDRPMKLSFNLFCSDSAIAPKNNFTTLASYPLAYLAIKNNISRKSTSPKLLNYPLIKKILASRIIRDSFNVKLSAKEDQSSNKLVFEASLDIPRKCAQLTEGFKISVPKSYELIFTQACQNQKFSNSKDFIHLAISNSFRLNELQMRFKLEMAIPDNLKKFTARFKVDNTLVNQKEGCLEDIKNAAQQIRRFASYLSFYTECIAVVQKKTNLEFRDENFLHIEHLSHTYEGDDLKTFVNFYFNLYSDHINEMVIRKIPSILVLFPIEHLPDSIKISLDFDIKSEFFLFSNNFIIYEDQRMLFTYKNLSIKTKNPLVYDLLYLELPTMQNRPDVALKNSQILEKMYGDGDRKEILRFSKKLENVALKENFKDYPISFSIGTGVHYYKTSQYETDDEVQKRLKINTSNITFIMNMFKIQDQDTSPFRFTSIPFLEIIEGLVSIYSHRLGPKYYINLNCSLSTNLLVTENEIFVILSKLPIRFNFISSPLTIFLNYSSSVALGFSAYGPLCDPVFEISGAQKEYNVCLPFRMFLVSKKDAFRPRDSINHYQITKYNEENCGDCSPLRLHIITRSNITQVLFKFKNTSMKFRLFLWHFEQFKVGLRLVPTALTSLGKSLVYQICSFFKFTLSFFSRSKPSDSFDQTDDFRVEALENLYDISEYDELYLYDEYAITQRI